MSLCDPDASHGRGMQALTRREHVAKTSEGGDVTRVHANGATNGVETSTGIGGVVERVQLASAAAPDRRAMGVARRELTRSTGARAKRQPAAPVEKRRVNVERTLRGVEPAMTIIGLQTEAETARECAGNA